MILYSYWRSTTSYRARIALNLKNIEFNTVPVNLLEAEQRGDEYRSINPSMGVPALSLDDGQVLTQSMAIIAYLDALAPVPALLPADPLAAATVSAAAQVIASDIHPVNNLKVTARLKQSGMDSTQVNDWMNHWMHQGFTAYLSLIEQQGDFSFGDSVTLADICLIPQLYNAHRWELDLSPFSRLTDIEQHCLSLPAFNAALPENQPDAQ